MPFLCPLSRKGNIKISIKYSSACKTSFRPTLTMHCSFVDKFVRNVLGKKLKFILFLNGTISNNQGVQYESILIVFVCQSLSVPKHRYLCLKTHCLKYMYIEHVE